MKFSLDAVLMQQGIDYEIVVADDGSKDSLFTETVTYLLEHGARDFTYVLHEINKGTSHNMCDGVAAAEGLYIKGLGAGDGLVGPHTLKRWRDHLRYSNRKWSIADYRCFIPGGEKLQFTSQIAHPQLMDCYLQRMDEQCRYNYVILNDIACGASTMLETKFMLDYLEKVRQLSKLAEDHIYRLMMLDGYVADYFPEDCVLYEWGEGMSTQQHSPYAKQLQQDWKCVDRYIYSIVQSDNSLYKHVRYAYKDRDKLQLKIWRFIKFLHKGYLKYWFTYRFKPRRTK